MWFVPVKMERIDAIDKFTLVLKNGEKINVTCEWKWSFRKEHTEIMLTARNDFTLDIFISITIPGNSICVDTFWN